MTSNHKWFRSAAWDGFWIMSGLWAPAIMFFFLQAGWSQAFFYGFLSIRGLVSGLHLVMPIAMVSVSPLFAEARAKSPGKYYGVPLAMIGTALALTLTGVYLEDAKLDPKSMSAVWSAFGLLSVMYVAWIIWHFTAQHFGVMSLYRAKAEQRAPLERLVDRYFCIITGIVLQSAVWADRGFHLGAFLNLFGPGAGEIWPGLGMHAAAAAAVLTVAYVIYEGTKEQASLPKILYSLSVGIQPVAAWYWPDNLLISHVLIYMFPHHMIEIGFQTHIGRRYYRATAALKGYRARIFAAVGATALLLALSYSLHSYKFISQLQSEGILADRFIPDLAMSPSAIASVVGIYSLVFLHFLFGAYIYNLRNKDTGPLIAALLLGKDEPVTSPRAAPANDEEATAKTA